MYIIPAVTMRINCVGSKYFMQVQSDNTSVQVPIECLWTPSLIFTSEYYYKTIPDIYMFTNSKNEELGECVNFC